jgi:hypothetical protein
MRQSTICGTEETLVSRGCYRDVLTTDTGLRSIHSEDPPS